MQIEKKFYNEKHRPYYICAPGFTRVSNGVRAMHLLCHYLNKLGEEAYVFTPETDPKLRTPYLTQDIVDRHKATKRSPIVVYPEVVHGNPLNASSVVRYILNHPGLLGGPKDYPESDMLVFWHQDYVDFAKYTDPSYIFIPSIDTGIFNNDDNTHDDERHLTLVYPGRYKHAERDFPELFKDSTVITYDWPQSHEELAALLRQGRVVYTFANSAIISEALLCGCPVVIKETVYSKKPEERAGVALGLALPGVTFEDTPEAIAAAHAKVQEYQQVYHQYQLDLLGQLEIFIDKSQQLPQSAVNEVVCPVFLPAAEPSPEEASYNAWMARQALTPIKAQLHAERMVHGWPSQPRFIILMPVTSDRWPEAIKSINALNQQLYKHWQLIFVADFDEPSAVFQYSDVLGWLRIDDARDAGQLTQAYAAVLGALPSDWIGILPPGAVLEPHALLSLGDHAAQYPEWQAVYSDSDAIAADGRRSQPAFRPDFNLDLLRGFDYVGHGAWFRSEALQGAGAFADAPGADGYDALLRVHDQYGAAAIGHIADMLLHLPAMPDTDVTSAQGSALAAHLARQGCDADVAPGMAADTRRVRYAAPANAKLSIVVADAGDGFHLAPCIDALLAALDGAPCEILAVAPQAELLPAEARLLSCDPALGLPARYQLGAEAASGDYLLFLDSRVEIVQPESFAELLGLVARDEVGAVAPRLLRPDGAAVWRGPLLFGADDGAATVFDGADAADAGHLRRQAVEHNPSGLLLDCLLIARPFYREIGGIDASLPDAFNAAVDLSLKVRAAGKWLVWTPQVSARRHEDAGPRAACDADAISSRWQGWLGQDPAHNRHLGLESRQAFRIDNVFSAEWDTSFHERIRVLALPGESKSGAQRLCAPLKRLQEGNQCLATLTPVAQRMPGAGEMERLSPDVLLQSVRFDPSFLDWQRSHRRRRPGVLSVLALDGLDFGTEMTTRYGLAHLRALAREVDRIIVPTEALRRMVGGFAPDVRVVPDTLDEARWEGLQSLRRIGKKPRVGWVGTGSDAGDLLLLSGIMMSTAEEVDWIVLGDCPDVLKFCLAEHHPFDLCDDGYPAKLASLSLDIAVLPKAATLANEAASPLRLYEYGMLGIPVVCSAVGELNDTRAPAAKVEGDMSSWSRALREWTDDAGKATSAGDALRAWVRENCLLGRHLSSWQQVIGR
ncbi:hypothetical protein B0T49_18905 [Chromobacterium violaceum]|uniref:hypothetical protein n=1 Tax=Chromobacterium violaceum TaxID=536 RepID=UPI0009DB595A|nr:hypothetical protein [Chromobacterium violaceum]OQS45238.1 hypothetical protein B0T48_20105 [Chromobacterium violaceum]OQS46869.1 hypothetical protein B0T49_18905 [Chromobacterium violaceum]